MTEVNLKYGPRLLQPAGTLSLEFVKNSRGQILVCPSNIGNGFYLPSEAFLPQAVHG